MLFSLYFQILHDKVFHCEVFAALGFGTEKAMHGEFGFFDAIDVVSDFADFYVYAVFCLLNSLINLLQHVFSILDFLQLLIDKLQLHINLSDFLNHDILKFLDFCVRLLFMGL